MGFLLELLSNTRCYDDKTNKSEGEGSPYRANIFDLFFYKPITPTGYIKIFRKTCGINANKGCD